MTPNLALPPDGGGPNLSIMFSLPRVAIQGGCGSVLSPGRLFCGCRLAFHLVLAASFLAPFLAEAGTTNSWRVFRSLSSGATLGSNRVLNPGMETAGSGPPLASWIPYGSGYTASTTAATCGT